MQLVPTEKEIIELLRQTGALKSGNFVHQSGLHASEYLQMPLVMRYYQHAKTLCVGLSRKLRAHTDIRAMIPELSIVAPAPNGLPVAYGVCEALHAKQAYWAARGDDGVLRFPQYLEVHPGEKVVLVDDILRTGKKLTDLKRLVEDCGAQVVAIAVLIYQPAPDTPDFSPVPLYYLAKLDSMYYRDGENANRLNAPAEPVWT